MSTSVISCGLGGVVGALLHGYATGFTKGKNSNEKLGIITKTILAGGGVATIFAFALGKTAPFVYKSFQQHPKNSAAVTSVLALVVLLGIFSMRNRGSGESEK